MGEDEHETLCGRDLERHQAATGLRRSGGRDFQQEAQAGSAREPTLWLDHDILRPVQTLIILLKVDARSEERVHFTDCERALYLSQPAHPLISHR